MPCFLRRVSVSGPVSKLYVSVSGPVSKLYISVSGQCDFIDRHRQCQINILKIPVTHHRINSLLITGIKPGRAMEIVLRVDDQPPYSFARIQMNIVQLLYEELIGVAFQSKDGSKTW